jgi:hypothetical protein
MSMSIPPRTSLHCGSRYTWYETEATWILTFLLTGPMVVNLKFIQFDISRNESL